MHLIDEFCIQNDELNANVKAANMGMMLVYAATGQHIAQSTKRYSSPQA